MNAQTRPDPRPQVREPSSREAAEKRTLEILSNFDVGESGADKFAAPPAPDGWEYEFKRRTVYNQEDPAYQISLSRTGWQAVPASRHPGEMPLGGNHQTIERDGMVLMERPKMISDRVRERDRKMARDQVRVKEQQLSTAPDGQFERNSDARTRPNIKKSFEAMPIPD
jgi:hypothetical protein